MCISWKGLGDTETWLVLPRKYECGPATLSIWTALAFSWRSLLKLGFSEHLGSQHSTVSERPNELRLWCKRSILGYPSPSWKPSFLPYNDKTFWNPRCSLCLKKCWHECMCVSIKSWLTHWLKIQVQNSRHTKRDQVLSSTQDALPHIPGGEFLATHR